MDDFLGLHKQIRSIRGSLKVEVAKELQLEERIKQEKCKLTEIRDNPEYDNGITEDIRKELELPSLMMTNQLGTKALTF